MVIQVTGQVGREDGILLIDDKTSRLLVVEDNLPPDVALKAYLGAVRRKQLSGTITSTRDRMTYQWKVISLDRKDRPKQARRGWRAAVLV